MSHLRKLAREIARAKGIPYYRLKARARKNAKTPGRYRGWRVTAAVRMIGWPHAMPHRFGGRRG